MNRHIAFLSMASAIIAGLFFACAWTAQAAQPDYASSKTGPQVAQTSASHYESFMERLQKQWRVDPLIADAHSLSSTGWENPACAPRSSGQAGAANVSDPTAKCVEMCMKGVSLENPNGLLFCRRSCL